MPNSREVQELIGWLLKAGVPAKVTDINSPGVHTTSSYHYREGTGGQGLAVDFAGLEPSRRSPELLRIFAAFGPVESQLAELIYSGAPYSIKNGQRVPRYAIATHWDHVHVAVPKGTFLTMADDPKMPNITGPVSFHPVVDADGKCWGYYIFSTATAEVHAWGDPDHVVYYGRSEVIP